MKGAVLAVIGSVVAFAVIYLVMALVQDVYQNRDELVPKVVEWVDNPCGPGQIQRVDLYATCEDDR